MLLQVLKVMYILCAQIGVCVIPGILFDALTGRCECHKGIQGIEALCDCPSRPLLC